MPHLQIATEAELVLKNTAINAEQPGPILRDFEVMLHFIGTDGVKATGKYNLLPIDAIPVLDERLSRPLHLNLKRPQLRSHPYLQGLQLLLRATGLTKVDGVGAKARLRVNPAMAEQWNRLNPTEQFFNLMEAGFLHGQGEMIGESARRTFSSFLNLLSGWRSLSPKGRQFDSRLSVHVYLLYRQQYILALADLFGLLSVEQPPPGIVPWAPEGVRHTAFGNALFSLMDRQDFEVVAPIEEPTSFGFWQPILQPYFPEWRENLAPPQAKHREGVFVFKASLGNIWRQIAIPHDLTLDHLASAILQAVEFDSDHLYEFSFRDALGKTTRVNHPYSNAGPWTSEFLIGDLPLEPGQSMTFLFDYGDNWTFNVKLEKIEPAQPGMKEPTEIGERGEAPQQYPDWD